MENFVKFKLKSWIDIKKLYSSGLSSNPHPKAIELLQSNDLENSIQFHVEWERLSNNPYAIELLKKNPDKINWLLLSSNPGAIQLLKENPDKINWHELSLNPAAIQLLKENPDKINWAMLSENPNAIYLLRKNPDKIDWGHLSINPNAIELLHKKSKEVDSNGNPNRCYYGTFNKKNISIDYLGRNPILTPRLHDCKCPDNNRDPCSNYNFNVSINAIYVNLYKDSDRNFWIDLSRRPNAIDLLKQYPDRIDWINLSHNSNPDALELLQQNPDKIVWQKLSKNPNIFEIDTYHYSKLKERMDIFRDELLEIAMHPNRIDYFR
jgi:ribosomal protein L24E